ncbi:MAG: hypothetical protein ABGX06_03435, partial [Candidatus Poseidoniia archaeon]
IEAIAEREEGVGDEQCTIMSAISIHITTLAGDPGYGQVTIAIVWAIGVWWLAKKVPTRA